MLMYVMEKTKDQQYLEQYTLTRSEMAKELGITTNALKCRMRKGNTDGIEFRHDGNKFLFKGLRGNQGHQTPVIRPKGRWHEGNKKKKKDYSVNRGATHVGLGNYSNQAFKEHNERKIIESLHRNLKILQNRKDPTLVALAQKQNESDLEKATGKFDEPKYYGGLNPRNNSRYTNSFNTREDTEVNTGFNPLRNYDYYSVGSSEDRRDTRPTVYTFSEPKVKEPGSDYKPGKFKHLDDAISKAKKR